MEKNVLYLADSAELQGLSRFPIFDIVALTGTQESIELVSSKFNKLLGQIAHTDKSLAEWIGINDNGNALVNLIMQTNSDERKCSFINNLSDHNYAKFAFFIRNICSYIDNGPIENVKDIDSLFNKIDSSVIDKIQSNLNVETLADLIEKIKKSVNDIFSIEKRKAFVSSLYPVDDESNIFTKYSQAILSDISIADYINYSLTLTELCDDCEIESIFTYKSCAVKINACLESYRLAGIDKNSSNLTIEDITNQSNNAIGLFMHNIIILSHYLWNKFHAVENVEELSNKEQLVLASLWILFQSKYSNWMISSEDFTKMKKMFDCIRKRHE